MTLVQTAIKDIYIGAGTDDYSAMQGPAPSGFHVPSKDEWQAVYNVWTALGGGSSDGTNFGIALKLPFAGQRNTEGGVGHHSTYGLYWSSSRNNASKAYRLYFYSAALNPQSDTFRAYGESIRPFKNSTVVPTSSRTKLYGTSIEAGGIFWSSADGLISMSSDGQTWITIADKNLGATAVWNSGDTLSQANCGNYYQWGNNYGFPFTGGITTSSTKVDASNYGPGNYYSSSTFITVSSTPYDWSSVQNDNLRGGETGVVKKGVSKVYLGSTQVRPEMPPLYFTANTAGSTVQLNKTGSPTAVTLETSTDGTNWSTYTFGSIITLSNIGDKVYWRNTSTTTTGFGTDTNNCYKFAMSGSIAGSGDVTTLLNRNGTLDLSESSQGCLINLFSLCTSLTSCPSLPATTLTGYCYTNMFFGCSALTTLPELPATTLTDYCYNSMFNLCTNIKLSSTQTGIYPTPYRLPTEGTGTTATNDLNYMFANTGGTFTGTPSINTTYYTSNTVV